MTVTGEKRREKNQHGTAHTRMGCRRGPRGLMAPRRVRSGPVEFFGMGHKTCLLRLFMKYDIRHPMLTFCCTIYDSYIQITVVFVSGQCVVTILKFLVL